MVGNNRKINVVVESVLPLNAEQQEKIFRKLKEVLAAKRVEVQFRLNPDLMGGMTVRIGSDLLDLSQRGGLRQFEDRLNRLRLTGKDFEALSRDFKQQIEAFEPQAVLSEVGSVLSVADGVVRVAGLNTLMAGEIVRFASGPEGIALNLNPTTTDVLAFNRTNQIREGDHAFATGNQCTVPVGLSLLGRVINPLGEALDGGESLARLERRPLFAPAPGIVDRDKVQTPLPTGIKAVDALIPIGRGQRELIIGDRQTGKTALIIDTILNQKKNNDQAARLQDKIYCVYVAVGQKQSTLREVMQTLKKKGALDYTVIVSASASDSAVLQYLAPYAGCAVGEFFRDKGMHAVVFYDDLSKHAVAYREMSLLLKRPAGREAFPGDVFYLHARLLERAAQMNVQNGGGSLTAIPVVETQEGDVSAYIPTNVISITDGQIFLDTTLFHQGIRPAVNVGLSVSRVGAAAQNKSIKTLSASLKLNLSQYREVLSFAQLASDLDSTTRELLSRGEHLTEMMKQPAQTPLSLAEEVMSLAAGTHGYLDTIPVGRVGKFLSDLTAHARVQSSDLMSVLNTGDWNPEIAEKTDAFIRDFLQKNRQEDDEE